MLKTGILNPALLALLAQVRHTNLLVIADRGFPYWPAIETIDLSLVNDIPTVLDVLAAIRPVFVADQAWMAEEFLQVYTGQTRSRFAAALEGISLSHEPHMTFKQRVPGAIGLVRTGDTIQYANIILRS